MHLLPSVYAISVATYLQELTHKGTVESKNFFTNGNSHAIFFSTLINYKDLESGIIFFDSCSSERCNSRRCWCDNLRCRQGRLMESVIWRFPVSNQQLCVRCTKLLVVVHSNVGLCNNLLRLGGARY